MEKGYFQQKILPPHEVLRAIETPDLTEPAYSEHAIGILYSKLETIALGLGIKNTVVARASPRIPIPQHYDELLFAEDAGVRSSLNSQYIDKDHILRGHTAANIPPVLGEFSESEDREILIVSPGICFRSDKGDTQHASIIHQVDIWYIDKNGQPDEEALLEFAERLATQSAGELVPGWELSVNSVANPESSHPYLQTARKMKTAENKHAKALTLLEYGTLRPELLDNFQLNGATGIAMGVILERPLMLRKKLPDVRLVTSQDEAVLSQMNNLDVYKEPTSTFEYARDLSIIVPREMIDTICGDIERYIQEESGMDSTITVKSSTGYDDLPEHVRERLVMVHDQVNILLGVFFRSTEPKSRAEINELRNTLLDSFNQ